jgi:hypothetical protein
LSGGTRIRTGNTMISSHLPRPLGMRKTRIGKRIFVQGVPLDTIWFCPYCCATVDTGCVIRVRHQTKDAYIRSATAMIITIDPGRVHG